MKFEIYNAIIQTAIAIGTVGSLWYAIYLPNRRKRKLWVTSQFSEHFSENYLGLTITIENLGNTPVIINQIGTADPKYKNICHNNIKKYLVSDIDNDYILIQPNDAKIIEFRKEINYNVAASNVEEFRNEPEYKELSEAVIYLEDTTGKIYSNSLKHNFKKKYIENNKSLKLINGKQ